MIRIFLSIFFLTSCTTSSMTFSNLYESFKPFFDNNADIPEKYQSGFPYAYASLRFGRGRYAYVVLSSASSNNILKWVSSDGVEVYTINGKIIKTNGLPEDIDYIFPSNELEIDNLQSFSSTVNLKRNGSFETTFFITREKSNNLIRETIICKDLRWSFKNLFELNNDGRVIKSINYINPFTPKIEMKFYNLHPKQ